MDSSCSISRQTVGGSGTCFAKDAPKAALPRLNYEDQRAKESSTMKAALRRLAPGHAIRSVDVPNSGACHTSRCDIVPRIRQVPSEMSRILDG
jgi:hypothetical protein